VNGKLTLSRWQTNDCLKDAPLFQTFRRVHIAWPIAIQPSSSTTYAQEYELRDAR